MGIEIIQSVLGFSLVSRSIGPFLSHSIMVQTRFLEMFDSLFFLRVQNRDQKTLQLSLIIHAIKFHYFCVNKKDSDIPTVSHGGENDVLFAISDMIKDERQRLTTEVGETLDTKFDTRGLHSDKG